MTHSAIYRARSSSKEEYHTFASATCELQWLTFLLEDLGGFVHDNALLWKLQCTTHCCQPCVPWTYEYHLGLTAMPILLGKLKCLVGLMRLLSFPSCEEIKLLICSPRHCIPLLFITVSKLGMVEICHHCHCIMFYFLYNEVGFQTVMYMNA